MAKELDDILIEAVRAGDMEKVRQALDAGADVNAKSDADTTPLHIAAYKDFHEIAALLLERGANVNAKDKHSWTPLHSAAQNGRSKIVTLLLKHAADVHAKNIQDNMPLHCATAYGHTKVMQALINHGADVNAKGGGSSLTPLHRAAYYGHTEAVQLLLTSGADPTITDEESRTAVKLAKEDALAELLKKAAEHWSILGPHSRRIKAQQTRQTWEEGI